MKATINKKKLREFATHPNHRKLINECIDRKGKVYVESYDDEHAYIAESELKGMFLGLIQIPVNCLTII